MEVNNGPACWMCAYSSDEDYRGMECRIKPPSPDYKNNRRMFPIVRPDDWCAKYKAKVRPEPKPNESLDQILDEWIEEGE